MPEDVTFMKPVVDIRVANEIKIAFQQILSRQGTERPWSVLQGPVDDEGP